ncbi:hypothetical protein [Sphingomonas sp. OK281]|uniref:hypothetical protein n=1 Tax=Sphingomonas sp. OK281 TaxID=1881067 RepID=UPI0008F2E55F|nr:hypothetical protein [Sphingomonas sp. OK281]SFO03434.1 hypothetical protein SAMN05428984_1754 [Sphingomonas sp. OK281]
MNGVETGRPKFRVEWKDGVEHLRLPAQKAWVGSAVLSIWLLFWAWGGSKAVISHYQDAMTLAWLVVFVLVLAATAVLLVGQLVGVDIIRVHHGELAITRRAGPFARTWRYDTRMIDNLRIDMSQWAGEDTDGAQYVPFTKQQWGTVRFDYGAETIHLAPHVDAPEALQIADWLRRRLPVSVSC